MHIFIDESGTFTPRPDRRSSISAVGALVIPSSNLKGFCKLYSRMRPTLPKHNGEVKGRMMSEEHVSSFCDLLFKIGAIFEVSIFDYSFNSETEVEFHKKQQSDNLMTNITPDHQETLVKQVLDLQHRLEKTSNQLYIQSVVTGHLIYNTFNAADLYYSQHLPKELGAYHWVIDAKDRSRVTPWEDWWRTTICPMLESKSIRHPGIKVEFGNYKWQNRFKMELNDFKLSYINPTKSSEFDNIGMIMRESFRFSSEPEFGLEAVDILTTTVRRSLAGNFKRPGWLKVPRLMLNREGGCLPFVLLGKEIPEEGGPYASVLRDFAKGGRAPFSLDKDIPYPRKWST